jgi:hypothetical protein
MHYLSVAELVLLLYRTATFVINITGMNKILLPEFPGNNLLFHAISNGNTVDAVNLL